MSRRVLLAWSSGKDSAWALHRLRADPELEIAGLFTTVQADGGPIPIHGVRRSLLREQSVAVDLPLFEIEIPNPCPNSVYEARLARFAASVQEDGVRALAFGDLHLEEIRAYRERQFRATGLALLFPLWREPTGELAREMIAGGLEAWIVSVDLAQGQREWLGQRFDAAFIAGLPVAVDPCGERGEFHSFVSDGPMFRRPVCVAPGPVTERGGFAFVDLVSSAPC